jgi:hypothetical protein
MAKDTKKAASAKPSFALLTDRPATGRDSQMLVDGNTGAPIPGVQSMRVTRVDENTSNVVVTLTLSGVPEYGREEPAEDVAEAPRAPLEGQSTVPLQDPPQDASLQAEGRRV